MRFYFAPTDFGKSVFLRVMRLIITADGMRRWDILKGNRLNANYEPAYSAIGKNYLMKNEYRQAMYYFKLGKTGFFIQRHLTVIGTLC
jgi:hypothetical protein